MIHKSRICLFSIAFLATFLSLESRAERRTIIVLETSTSGKLVRISEGASAGLRYRDPVLFSVGDRKVAAGRVIRVEDNRAVVAVLEKYGTETPGPDMDYELLYGEPFEEAENLPDYVEDREAEEDNPANERFFTPTGEERGPELDDDDYTPEVTLRPKLPEPRTYSPHNITVGLSLFRNRALATEAAPDTNNQGASRYTTYTGYAIRYAYTFRTNYWLRAATPALISAEAGMGIYNFTHTFPDSTVTQVRVIPLSFQLRYLIEVSKLFRLYPYVGYQNNIVSAVNGDLSKLETLSGGRFLGGAGAQLVMSDTIDARLEGGSDGVLAGLVVKF